MFYRRSIDAPPSRSPRLIYPLKGHNGSNVSSHVSCYPALLSLVFFSFSPLSVKIQRANRAADRVTKYPPIIQWHKKHASRPINSSSGHLFFRISLTSYSSFLIRLLFLYSVSPSYCIAVNSKTLLNASH